MLRFRCPSCDTVFFEERHNHDIICWKCNKVLVLDNQYSTPEVEESLHIARIMVQAIEERGLEPRISLVATGMCFLQIAFDMQIHPDNLKSMLEKMLWSHSKRLKEN